MDPEKAGDEISILEEKLRALLALVKYERDLDKLKVYKRELDLVSAELQRGRDTKNRPQASNVVPFKKPVRSA